MVALGMWLRPPFGASRVHIPHTTALPYAACWTSLGSVAGGATTVRGCPSTRLAAFHALDLTVSCIEDTREPHASMRNRVPVRCLASRMHWSVKRVRCRPYCADTPS